MGYFMCQKRLYELTKRVVIHIGLKRLCSDIYMGGHWVEMKWNIVKIRLFLWDFKEKGLYNKSKHFFIVSGHNTLKF